MDEDTKQMIDDCFLRPVVNASASNAGVKPPPPKAPVKVELQVLRMSENSQELVMETLRKIHGPDFELGNESAYRDKGSKLKKTYWEERGNLVIQGICDYSNVPKTGSSAEDMMRFYAIRKIESYGFHKNHCQEALEHTKWEIDSALKLLYDKYFPPPISENLAGNSASPNELLEMREDEKSALESIYERNFEEKEKNRIWQLRLKIEHLMIYSPSEKRKLDQELERSKSEVKVKKSAEKCRNFARGKCKYGEKCRFSHEVEKPADKPMDKHLEEQEKWFYLEVRFPEDCQYPYEAPLVLLKTTYPDFPVILCLRLMRMLALEARKIAEDMMPSFYTLSEMLQAKDQVEEFLRNNLTSFPDPKLSIFHVPDKVENGVEERKNLPTHYEKGSTGKSNKDIVSREELRRENARLVRKYEEKQSNPAYQSMMKIRESLPVWDKRKDILKLLEKSQVVVISGETGCGKSTQVPQLILDEWLSTAAKDGKRVSHVEIICTQPRRLSAIGVAQRVADERVERIGNTVGYQIRLENKISSATRLTFCTTGILLRRLQSDPVLANVSHVIVDEVHERSEESDFLLLILKELLERRSDLRVILMSATLNAKIFSEYFSGAPVLDIPGRTFPVEQLFLEDIVEQCNYVLEADSQHCRKLRKSDEQDLMSELEYADVIASNADPPRSIRDENLRLADFYSRYRDYSKRTCNTMFLMDVLKVNPELIESVLVHIVKGDHSWPREGTILIFLPGLAEIQAVFNYLSDHALFSPRAGNCVLVPLHSTLTNEEQSMVFQRLKPPRRKIVLSTNIAETSVTIDDCVFVIDCGHMKEKRFDSNRNMESLELVWVSRANALQRKGRAGRVMSGVAIHLFTQHRYRNHMLSQPVPEIHRVPLEQLLLRIKTLPNFASRTVEGVIKATIEPPTEEGILSAIKRLQDVGALDAEQNLTALGHHLATLPVDVRIGKLMLFGAIFQCVDSVLTIAACLSHKSPFVAPFSKKAEADSRKRELAVLNSDHLTVLRAYQRWREANKRSKYSGRCFAEENFLSTSTLEMLVEIKQQFLELLVSIGFIPIHLSGSRGRKLQDNVLELTGAEMNANGDNFRLLTGILCAALYPNVIKVLTPEKNFIMSMGGAVPRVAQPSELRFKTRDDGYVAIHPSSVNSVVGHFSFPFLVFQEKVKTSRIFVRESTMVPLLPLVLFSGSDVTIELHGGDFIILLEDGWIMLQAANLAVAEMVKCLRKELVQLLEQKIRDPCLNLLHHENGSRLIGTIVHLLTKE
ncbi:putative ATP-dependent RNA helicase DHX57 [Phlebotomus argentipes]|uniref:putative ATP-dependent RNA helicase DHX57 n=1 Tax=Phlebotomus argentipes TaxID=94469 RepID=UPI0028930BEE|nr:putative ATP-dependent RNA helicase DHX57 [Phlebotomus argentipes]